MEIKSSTGQINEQYLQGMSNRMDVSFYKYGDFRTNYKGKYKAAFVKDFKATIGGLLDRWESRIDETTTAGGNAVLFALRRLYLYMVGGEVKSGTVPAGNTEYLMDAGNGLGIEFECPQITKAKFVATDADKSPGFTGTHEREAEQTAMETYRGREGD